MTETRYLPIEDLSYCSSVVTVEGTHCCMTANPRGRTPKQRKLIQEGPDDTVDPSNKDVLKLIIDHAKPSFYIRLRYFLWKQTTNPRLGRWHASFGSISDVCYKDLVIAIFRGP